MNNQYYSLPTFWEKCIQFYSLNRNLIIAPTLWVLSEVINQQLRRSLLMKLIVVQLVSASFYGIQRFIHKRLALVTIQRQVNPFFNHMSNFFKINFNTILLFVRRSAMWSLSSLQIFLPQCCINFSSVPFMLFLVHSQLFKLHYIFKDLIRFCVLTLFWKKKIEVSVWDRLCITVSP